jgi:hypothetical protein
LGYSTGVPGCPGSAAGDWLAEGEGAGADGDGDCAGLGVGVGDPGRLSVGRCGESDDGDDCAAPAVAARSSSRMSGNKFRMKSVRMSEKVLLTLYPEDRIFCEYVKVASAPAQC